MPTLCVSASQCLFGDAAAQVTVAWLSLLKDISRLTLLQALSGASWASSNWQKASTLCKLKAAIVGMLCQNTKSKWKCVKAIWLAQCMALYPKTTQLHKSVLPEKKAPCKSVEQVLLPEFVWWSSAVAAYTQQRLFHKYFCLGCCCLSRSCILQLVYPAGRCLLSVDVVFLKSFTFGIGFAALLDCPFLQAC